MRNRCALDVSECLKRLKVSTGWPGRLLVESNNDGSADLAWRYWISWEVGFPESTRIRGDRPARCPKLFAREAVTPEPAPFCEVCLVLSILWFAHSLPRALRRRAELFEATVVVTNLWRRPVDPLFR
jgi:hypothetical protein